MHQSASAPSTDAELLARCREGDGAAWEALVRRYERLIFSVALRNGLSRADAADVTQNTFIALLDSVSMLRDDERLSFWLMTVARRNAWRIRRRLERETPWRVYEASDDPVAAWERVAVVQDALNQLEEPCQGLLRALYFDADRPTYSTVASRLGRAVGAIGPMRGRCLGRLRSLLGEEPL